LGAAATRITAATQERAAETALDVHRAAALLALDAGVDRLDRFALGIDLDDVLALGIAAAAEERAAFAHALHHRAAALFAHVLGRLAGDDRLPFGIEVHGGLAFRIATAAEERPRLAGAAHHVLAAIRTLDRDSVRPGGGARLFAVG